MVRLTLFLALCLAAGGKIASARDLDGTTCALQEGCGTADCGGEATLSVELALAADGWVLRSNGDIAGTFREAGDSDGAVHLLSTDIDPKARAAAMLSIFPDGEALLTVHGAFPLPEAATWIGQCDQELSRLEITLSVSAG